MSSAHDEACRAGKRQLLVVDDEEGVRRLLRTHLSTLGFEVDLCKSGQEALARARAHPPDLILLDVQMPVMNGYETCRRLREQESLLEIPIVMITALDDTDAKRSSAESGADDFISKPFRFEELLIRIKSLLRLKLLFDEEHERHRRLGELNDFKSRILSMAAHDLRNPLTGIKAHAEFAVSKYEMRPEVRESLDDIISSSRHMSDVLRDISDTTLLEQGALELQCERVSVFGVIRESIRYLNGQARERQFLIRGEDVEVLADRRRLRQIMTNLLGNAVKYSAPDSPVTLAVRARGDSAEIAVSDEGIGVPRELQGNLFTPFYRAGRKEIKDIPGTGLGLYIVKSLVEKHGGTIRMDSEPGTGSTLTFTLPRSA